MSTGMAVYERLGNANAQEATEYIETKIRYNCPFVEYVKAKGNSCRLKRKYFEKKNKTHKRHSLFSRKQSKTYKDIYFVHII